MSKISTELSNFASQSSTELDQYLKVVRYQDAYVNAVRRTCGDDIPMIELILRHTNAFYIRKDSVVRKGSDKGKPYIVCEVCIDDPIVRTEINMRREMLRLALMYDDIHVDEFRIIPAKLGMKARHPFITYIEEGRIDKPYDPKSEGAGRGAALYEGSTPTDESQELEIVKRAFCLTFGVNAEDILAQINAAHLEPEFSYKDKKERVDCRCYNLHLYSSDDDLISVIRASRDEIISHARELQLTLNSVVVHKAYESMKGRVAFPPSGNPIAYSTESGSSYSR